jgi:epoxyqueuosine reductase
LPENSEIAGGIVRKALELGFSACGFAPVRRLTWLEDSYREWLLSGKYGDMNYLARNVDVRLDPGKLLEGAKTVISLAAGYYHPLQETIPGKPRISRYALGLDYHDVLKRRGHELLQWLQEGPVPVKGRVFTDSAPLFEREWARLSGIGWIGKNGCLIIPQKGSWFFLVELVVDMDIPADNRVVPDRCGNCTRCIDACPTGCLSGDGSMDPLKCISYLTIEKKGDIPDEFRGKWNEWIFGCDVCQDVCPWNRKPEQSEINEFLPVRGIFPLEPEWLQSLDEDSFKRTFEGTPVLRTGWPGLKRNLDFITSPKED